MSSVIATLALAVVFSGCGYTWQGTSNPWAAQGVKKVYVRTLTNNTLRAGMEVEFTSALVKEFARGQRFKVVADEKDADAYIEGEVTNASSGVNNTLPVTSITKEKAAAALGDSYVATDYRADAGINVRLTRARDGLVLWSQSFGANKFYPGNNRFGLQGTTSNLINTSQEALALSELADSLASDAYDTMLEAF